MGFTVGEIYIFRHFIFSLFFEEKSVFQKVLDSGIAEFSDNKIKIWNDVYPTVQNELK